MVGRALVDDCDRSDVKLFALLAATVHDRKLCPRAAVSGNRAKKRLAALAIQPRPMLGHRNVLHEQPSGTGSADGYLVAMAVLQRKVFTLLSTGHLKRIFEYAIQLVVELDSSPRNDPTPAGYEHITGELRRKCNADPQGAARRHAQQSLTEIRGSELVGSGRAGEASGRVVILLQKIDDLLPDRRVGETAVRFHVVVGNDRLRILDPTLQCRLVPRHP
jgi:hypothetical protein